MGTSQASVWTNTFCLSFSFLSLCWFVILLFLTASSHMTKGCMLQHGRWFLCIQTIWDDAGILSKAERKHSRIEVNPHYYKCSLTFCSKVQPPRDVWVLDSLVLSVAKRLCKQQGRAMQAYHAAVCHNAGHLEILVTFKINTLPIRAVSCKKHINLVLLIFLLL